MYLRFFTLIGLALTLQAQDPAEPLKDLATLRYIDLKPGTGAAAAPGKKFTVHYTGWLKDGTKFDSSVDRNEPFHFVQGRRQVIAGWDIGFEGMRVGGRRRLIIPYQLAYGEPGSGPIPARAELTFEVELLNVSEAPPNVPAIDLLVPLGELEVRAAALATPERLRSTAVAEALRRVLTISRTFFAAAQKDDPSLTRAEVDGIVPAQIGTAELPAQLRDSFAELRKELEAARNGTLTADAVYLGQNTTRRGLFTELIARIAAELGAADAAGTQ